MPYVLKNPPWDEKENAKLREAWNDPNLSVPALAERFPGRTIGGCRAQAHKLGLGAKAKPAPEQAGKLMPNRGKRQLHGKSTLPPLSSLD